MFIFKCEIYKNGTCGNISWKGKYDSQNGMENETQRKSEEIVIYI